MTKFPNQGSARNRGINKIEFPKYCKKKFQTSLELSGEIFSGNSQYWTNHHALSPASWFCFGLFTFEALLAVLAVLAVLAYYLY
jgi:hypothetical protein